MAPLWNPPDAPAGTITQSVTQSLPLLALGNNDVAITWPVSFTTATYTVTALLEQGTASIGLVTPVLKAASRTTTGCTVTLVNAALVSIAAGAVLHVISTGS